MARAATRSTPSAVAVARRVLGAGGAAAVCFALALGTVAALSRALGEFDEAAAARLPAWRVALGAALRAWLVGALAYAVHGLLKLAAPEGAGAGAGAAVYVAFVAALDPYLHAQAAHLRRRLLQPREGMAGPRLTPAWVPREPPDSGPRGCRYAESAPSAPSRTLPPAQGPAPASLAAAPPPRPLPRAPWEPPRAACPPQGLAA